MTHRVALETPDGLLTIFNTPTPYLPGSLTFVLNGRTQAEGWQEIGSTAVKLSVPPQVYDVVSFYYTNG